MEKNQSLARSASDKLQNESARLEMEKYEMESQYKTQITSLAQENKILRAETSHHFLSEEEKDKFYGNLRMQLVEEIERLEKSHRMSEEELTAENSNLLLDSEKLTSEVSEMKKRVESENREWQIKLQDQATHHQMIENDLRIRIEEIDSYNKSLVKKHHQVKQDLVKTSKDYEVLSKGHSTELNEWEAKYNSDTKGLNKDLRQTDFINNQRMKQKAHEIELLNSTINKNTTGSDIKIQNLINERKLVEDQLKKFMEISGEKETHMEGEIFHLSELLENLTNLRENREKFISGEFGVLREEMQYMREGILTKEKILQDEAKKLMEERTAVKTILDQAETNLKSLFIHDTSLCHIQRKELILLHDQLAQKSSQITTLQVKANDAFNGPRKQLTSTLNKMDKFITMAVENEDKLRKELVNLSRNVVQADELHTIDESQTTQLLNAQSEQIGILKSRLRTFEEAKSEEKLTFARSQLAKTKQELNDAKKMLLSYINSLNSLEDKWNAKLKEHGPLVESDEMLRISNENRRLNEENAALINSRQKMEGFYVDELEKLNKKYIVKCEDFDHVLNKFSNLQETFSTKKLAEISSWKKRAENMRQTTRLLETRVNDLSKRNQELSKFKDEHAILISEELKSLRIEVNTAEGHWQGQHEVLLYIYIYIYI